MRIDSNNRLRAALLVLALAVPVIAPAQAMETRIHPPSGESMATAPFFDDFETGLDKKVWQVGNGWVEHDGKVSRKRAYVEDGLLTLEAENAGGELLHATINTRQEFLYGTWEFRARYPQVPGFNATFFTKDWLDAEGKPFGESRRATRQEIDIEVLTSRFPMFAPADRRYLHRALHTWENGGKDASYPAPIDPAPIDLGDGEFHVMRLDVLPDRVVWSIDGVQIGAPLLYADWTGKGRAGGTGFAIDRPYIVKLNLWGELDAKWFGPTPPGQRARYQIDWIRFTPLEGG
jgi:beta-glucanase (GH16 family)